MKAINPTTLESVKLVEHPAGHDGGDFPLYERFQLIDNTAFDGKALHLLRVDYSYGTPHSPTDTFSDQDPENYNNCPNKERAKARLRQELENLNETTQLIEKTLQALEQGAQYSVSCQNDDYQDEDEAYEEDEDE